MAELGVEELVGQFILSRSVSVLLETWSRRALGGWHLGFHPTLPVLDIQGSDSTVIGWLLGYPIDAETRLLREEVHFEITNGIRKADEQFEEWLYSHGGRFAAVFLDPETSRVYLDPCGSLAAVFCPEQQIVASTSSLIPYLNKNDDNHELIQTIEAMPEDTCYPFSLTHRRSVKRLLPSHYLDLERWQAIRHWPKGEIDVVQDVSEAVRELASLLKNNISAIARDYPLHLALTAGRDSRMLLACTREHVDRTLLYTVSGPGPGKILDWHIASRLARKNGLHLVQLHYKPAPAKEIEQWESRTGHCVHGSIKEWNSLFRNLDSHRAVLCGASGELGRGFHFRAGDTETSLISVEDLLEKSQMPNLPEIHRRAQQWRNELPIHNALTIWGLLYNETFNGSWFGPVHYGFTHNALYIWPFCHRRIIEIMLGLPREYRLDNRLPSDVVAQEWPELLHLPFNWYVGFRRYTYGLKWRWRRLKQKLNLGSGPTAF